MYVLHNAQTHFYTIITSLYTNTDAGILSMLTNTTHTNHYVVVSGSRYIPNLLALFLSLSLFSKTLTMVHYSSDTLSHHADVTPLLPYI